MLLMLVLAVVAHEPWRWAGYLLGRNLNPDGEVFRWVRAVSTSLVAALIARLVLFPGGALASIPLSVRVGSFVLGGVAFYLAGRKPWIGVGVGAGMVVLGGVVMAASTT